MARSNSKMSSLVMTKICEKERRNITNKRQKIEQCSIWGTKAWENIHNKNKGVRDFPYGEQRPGNFLTNLSCWASQQNMLFKGWQNLLGVPIALQHTYHSSSHLLLFHIFFYHYARNSQTCQCYSSCHQVQQGGLSSHLQWKPVFSKSSHHWLMDKTLTLSSLLV